jgi:hypothetical protein
MLKRAIAFALSAIIVLCVNLTPAQAWFRHGTGGGSPPPPVSCPQATDNGCAGANQNSSFIDINLLTSAQQSGQISFLPTRAGGLLNLNIPGVDYPIGPDGTLTPQDPRTINDGVCAWTPASVAVVCFATSGNVVHEILNNYDFSGTKIGKSSVGLYISTGGPGSTILVSNSYFLTPSANNTKIIGFIGNFNITFKNIQCDGVNAPTTGSSYCLGDDGQAAGTTVDIEYSAFTHVNSPRVYNGGNSGASRVWKYNFIQGLNDINSTTHGEVDLMSCGASGGTNCANKTNPLFHAEGNFIISNSLSAAYCASGGGAGGCTNSATWFLSAGALHGIKVAQTDLINNVIVTNTVGAPGTPTSTHIWGQAFISGGWASLGNLTLKGNWVDATGSTGCSVNGPASGNGTITASQSGTTLTITALGGTSWNNSTIENGWDVWRGGLKIESITAQTGQGGSGRNGGIGTYTTDTSLTLGSTSDFTLVPGHTDLDLTGNYNLADPSNTGVPTAMNISGATLAPASCLGAHN